MPSVRSQSKKSSSLPAVADADADVKPPIKAESATSAEPTNITSAAERVPVSLPKPSGGTVSTSVSVRYPNAQPVQVGENRAAGVGGSDAAAILGISPFRSRVDVWMEKTGHPMWSPQRVSPAMRWGTLLEPLLASEYARSQHVEIAESPGRIWHPNGVQFANVDRFVLVAGELVGMWEGKTAQRADDWAEGVPVHYLPQVQQYLAVAELPWCDVSVLLPGGDFRTFRIEADLEYQLDLEGEVMSFWNRYVARMVTPPEATIDIQYPAPVRQQRLAVEPGSALDVEFKTMLEIGRRTKALLAQYDELKQRVKAQVIEYEGADGPGYRLHYRQSRPPTTTDWEMTATALWNTLAVVRRFTPNPVPDLAIHLDPELWDTLVGMYTMKGKATRPFNLDLLEE